MKNYTDKADVFYGTGKINLPKAEGIAKSWYFIKAICGNNHPGAMYPFGRLSVGCFCNGYPTGYGNHRGNSCPLNLRTYPGDMKCFGFSHIHESGTGAIDVYYNYCVTTPLYGDLADAVHGFSIADEKGKPGYYGLTLKENNIKCEVTSGNSFVSHRYTFSENGGKIMINLANDGFKNDDKNHRGYSDKSYIKLLSNNEFYASIVMKQLPLYVYGKCEKATGISVMRDYLSLKDEKELSLEKVLESFGVVFDTPEKGEYELRLSISTVSFEKAKKDVDEGDKFTFNEIADNAEKVWNEALSRIDIETDNETDEEIFYSNFYHTLVKPSDWSGDNFLNDDEKFVVDFATLWDMYKTQLPLIFTLYSDISEKIISTFNTHFSVLGRMPHTFLLIKDDALNHSSQARMLAEYCAFDAFIRNVKGDYHSILKNAKKDIYSDIFADFHNNTITRYTHILDITDGCGAMEEMANRLGEDGSDFGKFTSFPEKVFDEKGLMSEEGDYYEGSEWNYSFRPMRDMEKRIEIAGGKENFVKLLDRFFGFTDAEDTSKRFEGFNNETDMETFLSYYYVDRSDRICEITDSAIKYMFTTGRGGLPGNNDSGGLSSCYLWMAMGIMPVAGQDLMIICSPHNIKSTMKLNNGKTFTVERTGKGIYVKNAFLNGTKLDRLSFKASEMMNGGTLLLEMSEIK